MVIKDWKDLDSVVDTIISRHYEYIYSYGESMYDFQYSLKYTYINNSLLDRRNKSNEFISQKKGINQHARTFSTSIRLNDTLKLFKDYKIDRSKDRNVNAIIPKFFNKLF
jgi:hypothetical protein